MSKRPRAARRSLERSAAKLVAQKWKLASLENGGTPERAILVPSASVVETHARSLPCVACGATVRVEEHTAEEHGGARLRVARVVCVQCGSKRALYFQIALPN
ncbi:hypothetical protein [Pendulispora albinea]|uniref:C2H2-type domain-containing protein n=1 Tax=Pendulispora albinea TaxID=2741071 RepID=A0ABZ2LXL1_9BACT